MIRALSTFLPTLESQAKRAANLQKSARLYSKTSPAQATTRSNLQHFRSMDLTHRHYVTVSKLKVTPGSYQGREIYPVLGNGLTTEFDIWDRTVTTEHLIEADHAIWGESTSFLPNSPVNALPASTGLSVLSDLGDQMAAKNSGDEAGLLAKKQLRAAVDGLDSSLHDCALSLIDQFLESNDTQEKSTIAKQLYSVFFWSQWLVRGYLFEPKLHPNNPEDTPYTSPVIPAPLSQLLDTSRAFFGRHQLEFVYDVYTLSSASFPPDFSTDDVDYQSTQSILKAIASIDTPVGFNDRDGANPEHNFRHNHSLMEAQMADALDAYPLLFSDDPQQVEEGWSRIALASERAHQVFKTMLHKDATPPESYPDVRLPIAGTRGNLGKVYPPEGVFYEGIGDERMTQADGTELKGKYIKNEWGQTGANSSMYKWFDILLGLSVDRSAYATDEASLQKMFDVLDGKVDSDQLDPNNPVRGMQLAFDLFTRPVTHMSTLVKTEADMLNSGLLERRDSTHLLGRLNLGVNILKHRMVHAQYVMKAIYTQASKGGQPKGTGTGGSPASQFLDGFLKQTLDICNELADELNGYEYLTDAQVQSLTACEKTIAQVNDTRTNFIALGEKLYKRESQ